MDITIPFNEQLKQRTLMFCHQDLEYHLNNSDSPIYKHHDEISAKLELLFWLENTERPVSDETAYSQYLKTYKEKLYQIIKNNEPIVDEEFYSQLLKCYYEILDMELVLPQRKDPKYYS